MTTHSEAYADKICSVGRHAYSPFNKYVLYDNFIDHFSFTYRLTQGFPFTTANTIACIRMKDYVNNQLNKVDMVKCFDIILDNL